MSTVGNYSFLRCISMSTAAKVLIKKIMAIIIFVIREAMKLLKESYIMTENRNTTKDFEKDLKRNLYIKVV